MVTEYNGVPAGSPIASSNNYVYIVYNDGNVDYGGNYGVVDWNSRGG